MLELLSKFNNKKIENVLYQTRLTIQAFTTILHINATSTILPVKSKSIDRVIAFESAQHFKPLIQFIQESNRVLGKRVF